MAQDPVMSMVERALKAQPDIPSSELHAKVAKKHAAIGKLSTRQFHARYPLRVKKRWSLESGGGTAGRRAKAQKKSRPSRRARKAQTVEGTRDLLVQFATELLSRPDASFTSVLAKVDKYAELLEGR